MFDADEQQQDITLWRAGAAQPAPCFKYFPLIYPQEPGVNFIQECFRGKRETNIPGKISAAVFLFSRSFKIKEDFFYYSLPPSSLVSSVSHFKLKHLYISMKYGVEGGSNGLFGSHLDINISSYCDRDQEYEYISHLEDLSSDLFVLSIGWSGAYWSAEIFKILICQARILHLKVRILNSWGPISYLLLTGWCCDWRDMMADRLRSQEDSMYPVSISTLHWTDPSSMEEISSRVKV